MKKEGNAFTLYAAICSLLMLAILFITLLTARKSETALKDEQTSDQIQLQSEYIYVYVTPESTESEISDTETVSGWIIREYEGQIGIFTPDNVLINTLNVYIKTLPVADRDLLREGIEVTTKKELLEVIEDYSG